MIKIFRDFPLRFNPGSVCVVFLLPTIILVTLPGSVIDAFILISFISSALLFVIMLENDKPLKVTFLPTIVLLLTTFRLLLSIATTRNIIANEDVGQVIETVGGFVMGGNLLSGLLIFVIITIVQFLVVTKGGERVAEVGARFSLDAMPGRQMTIDGDLKSGLITGEQAKKLRSDLTTENKLFGSLDGAMKFIKGDAIAGIIISLVNMFGGIYVGINQFGLSLSDSVSHFSVLTIGDGLVSQIPSLLLSMACGVYLTRNKASDEESSSFISQLIIQISTFWKSLLIIAGIILILGFLNLSLLYVCVPLSALCMLLAFFLHRRGKEQKVVAQFESVGSGVYESLKFVLRNSEHQECVKKKMNDIELILWGQSLGAPAIEIVVDLRHDIEVYISNICVCTYSNSEAPELIEIQNDEILVRDADLVVNLSNIVTYYLRFRLVEKYNLQYTNNIVANLGKDSEVMKKEIDSAIGLNRVHDVLKQMIRSPEFRIDSISFFEGLIHWSRVENEPTNWMNRIRAQARYDITSRLQNSEGKIFVALLSPEITEEIDGFVSGETENVDRLLELQKILRNEVIKLTRLNGVKPVLVVNDTELNMIKKFFQQVVSTMSVCSHGDIVDQTCIVSSTILNVDA
ncbi:FHIPEP family type III secretion protein [Citrobacter portucalensis]|uniref:FHIPEP family type III secretion protein n=1 Tax=Citrobacter portucalensis TaxID=1639133 RepID=UPI00226B73D9|nr:FHIPEP family type III secretion protein [Citrobacter portucalensis]MCX8985955.1 flagellar biosynthesis protein FlhA [Citrobacter portucalensis]